MSHSYTGSVVFDAAITLPDDGDTIDAASVNVAMEALVDRTNYLGQHVIIAESTPDLLANTWNADQYALVSSANIGLLANVAVTPGVQVGDIIRFSCTFYAKMSSTGSGWVTVFLLQRDEGNNIVPYATQCNIVYVEGSNAALRQFTIQGGIVASAASKDGTLCAISLYAKADSGTLYMHNPWTCTWEHLRTV